MSKRTIQEQIGYDTGVAYWAGTKPRGRTPQNPYTEQHNRALWSRGWCEALDGHVTRQRAAEKAREDEREARDDAERERIANRSPTEILHDSNLPHDVRDLLIRLVEKVGLE